MVTRRGYLSSTGGFADGFTSGFGLMNQAYTDRRKLDQAEELMQYERERDAARDAENLRQFNTREAADERRFQAQQAAADRTATAQEKANELQAGINQTRAETAQLQAEAAVAQRNRENAEAEAARSEADRIAYLNKARDALMRLDVYSQAPAGTYSGEDILAAMKETQGGVLDIYKYLDPQYQADMAGLTAAMAEDFQNGRLDGTNPAILAGLSSMFDARRGNLIGRTVDETFGNAPEQYRDGNWEVIDRFIAKVDSDPTNPESLTATATVVVKDKNSGSVAYYDAPVTEGRTPTGEPVTINIKDAIDGVAGAQMLLSHVEKHRPFIEKAIVDTKFGGDSAKFQDAVVSQMDLELRKKETNPDGRTIIPSKRNRDVTEPELEAIARSKVLGTGRERTDFRADRSKFIAETREDLAAVLSRAGEVVDGKVVGALEFTNSEILRLAAMMDGDKVTPAVVKEVERMTEQKGGRFAKQSGPKKRTAQDSPKFSGR